MPKLHFHIHDFTGVDPDCPVGFGALAEDYDEGLMCRIAAALERSLGMAGDLEPDVWTMIIANHKNFVDLLAQKDLRAGNDLLARMFATPEMASSVMRNYLRRGHSDFRRLLGINQEAMGQRSAQGGDIQERVGDVLHEIGGFRRLSRFPFWLQPGYVEEVYETLPLGIDDQHSSDFCPPINHYACCECSATDCSGSYRHVEKIK
jgi:hypothetical protein